MPMLLALAVLLLAAAAYFAGEVVTQPAREHQRSVRRAATYGRVRQSGPGLERLQFRERVLDPAVQKIAKAVLRLSPRMTTEVIAARLLAAGMSGSITPTAFLAVKGAAAAGGVLLGFVVGGALGGAGAALPLGLVFGGVGFVVPGFAVSVRARKRREAIRTQLPDALDLLAVSVEAGLGFDGAVVKLTEHMEGALADEFSLTLGEMRIGETRHDALKKLAARAASPEVSSFSRAIIQADQLGISLGRILRLQATDSRLKRQDAAEERAMKSPIKMLFPTVVFIFPAMFIVVLGPAFLQLSKLFEF
jgi:tight adherence protein C